MTAAAAIAVDIFHGAWVVMWIGLTIVSFKVRSLRLAHQVVTYATIATQIAFLGCPLTLLAQKLRGAEYQGSFVNTMLRWSGVEVHPGVIMAATAVIWAIAALFTWRAVRWADPAQDRRGEV